MNEMIASYEKYSIYKIMNKRAGTYYLCVPNEDVSYYQMFLGFANQDLDRMSKEEVIAEIKNVNGVIQDLNSHAVYALPVLPVAELEQAALENDNRKYNDILFNKIKPITSDIFRMLIEANRGTKQMDEKIHIVKKNDFDKKFAGWLATHPDMSKYIVEEDFQKIKEQQENKEKGISFADTATPLTNVQNEQENNLEKTVENQFGFSSGIAPVKRYDDELVQGIEKSNVKRRTLKMNDNNMSPGFSSVKFIIITLIVSLVVGITFSYLLIK